MKFLLLAADSDETSAVITFVLAVWATALADDFLFRFFFAVGAAA